MNINNYKKYNNNYYNTTKKNCYKNNLNKNCTNNSCNNKFNLDSLYEIEHFLCNFKSACKCINLYKFLK